MRRRMTVVFLALIAATTGSHLVTRRDRAVAIPNRPISHLVVLGDSVAHGAGDEKGLGISGWLHDGGATTINLGINGARTVNVARLLRDAHVKAMIAQADALVLSIGGNDLYGDAGARLLTTLAPWFQRERTLSRVGSLVARLHRINPQARICILGLYNPYRSGSVGRWIDEQVNLWDSALIERLSKMRGVTVIRLADALAHADRLSTIDHFHPGTLGYAVIARRIADTF